ncbi:hypothetical protein AB0N14_29025 [Streptomyces sp. NPDC051104]|uniref:hypothetical protein n=1 Tax=Streptomyces sp. NPDC051104 TaxID=3155044 RepID=UPI00341EF4BA
MGDPPAAGGGVTVSKLRILDRTRLIGLLITVPVVAIDIPLAAPAFRDHVLWAYGLFELLFCVPLASIAMLIMGDHFEEPGGDTKGDDEAGLGGL